MRTILLVLVNINHEKWLFTYVSNQTVLSFWATVYIHASDFDKSLVS